MKECSKFVESSSTQVPAENESQQSDIEPPLLMISTDRRFEPPDTYCENDTDSSYEEEMKAVSRRMPQMLAELNSHYSAINEKSKLKFNKQKAKSSKPKQKVRGDSAKSTTSAIRTNCNSIEKSSAIMKRQRTSGLKSKYHQKLPPKPGTTTGVKTPINISSKSSVAESEHREGSSGTDYDIGDQSEKSLAIDQMNDSDQSSESDGEMLQLKNLSLKNDNSLYGRTYYDDVSVRKNRNLSIPSDISGSEESNETSMEIIKDSFFKQPDALPTPESDETESSTHLNVGKRHPGKSDGKLASAFLGTENHRIDLMTPKSDITPSLKISTGRRFKPPQTCGNDTDSSYEEEMKLVSKRMPRTVKLGSKTSAGQYDKLNSRMHSGNEKHHPTKKVTERKQTNSNDTIGSETSAQHDDVLKSRKHTTNKNNYPAEKDIEGKQRKPKDKFGSETSAKKCNKLNLRDQSDSNITSDVRKQVKSKIRGNKTDYSKKIQNPLVTTTNIESKEISRGPKEEKKSTHDKGQSKAPKRNEFIPKAILKRPQSSEESQAGLSIISNQPSVSKSAIEPQESVSKEEDDEMDMTNFLDKMLEETSVVTPVATNASAITQRTLPLDEDLDKLFEESLSKPSFASRKRILSKKLT